MAQICIAYESTSCAEVVALQSALERAGYEPWQPPPPEEILRYAAWVEDQIQGAWAMLVVLAPDTHSSPVLIYQYACAIGANVPLIPLTTGALSADDLLTPLVARDPLPLARPDAWMARLHNHALAASTRIFPVPPDAPASIISARQQLDDADPAVRAGGVAQLAGSNDPVARAVLLGALTHPIFPDVRARAVEALAQRGDPAAIPALVEALGDSVQTVTQAAITALAATGAEAIDALHGAILGTDRWQRNAAILALARIDSGDTVPALIDALGVDHWFSSRAAAVRLARVGDQRAVPALRAALERDDVHLRALAEQALAALER